MQIRLFKITALLLFIFSGYFAPNSIAKQNNSTQSFQKLSLTTESLTKDPRNPYNYECVVNSIPVQVNVQQHRNVHFWQVTNSGPSSNTISVRYLNLICGRGNITLSRFRKLILFPFHVFW